MSLLLLGANGQVGCALQRSLAPLGHLKACDRHSADLEDTQALASLIHRVKPGIIVNAAAYTAVDQAESERAKAETVNTKAVAVLAEVSRNIGALLVHYSTDYVFDGNQEQPYREQDPTNPLSVYGQTKLAGEQALKESGCKHLIFRTSWVYANGGHNFPSTILRLARERDSLSVVADQYGAPTHAELIADVTALCLYRISLDPGQQKANLGTYHMAAQGKTNWHEFAQYLITAAQEAGLVLQTTPEGVQAINSDEYTTAAQRPTNSLLNTQNLTETFGIYLPPWQYHARRFIAQIAEQEAK